MLFAFAALACGGATSTAPDEPGAPISGGRLRARWEVAGEARRLVGWHDTKLGVDCGFERYQSGRRHLCLPGDVARATAGFEDSACTVPVVTWSVDPMTSGPRYALSVPTDPCNDPRQVFELDAPFPVVPYVLENGACVLSSGAQNLYRGKPISATTFVAASERPDERGQLWLEAEDGARAPWGGWDGARAVEPTSTPDGKTRWAPWIVAYRGLDGKFSDSSCASPTADLITDIGYCPVDGVLSFDYGKCGGVPFYAIGDRLDAVFATSNGQCGPAPPQPGNASYAVGPRIADGAMPEADHVLTGTGPVQMRYATLDGRRILQTGIGIQLGGHGPPPPDTFVDVRTGLPCAPQQASDGAKRCLPKPMQDSLYFSDASCSEQLLYVAPSTCETAQPPAFYVDNPGGQLRIRSVAESTNLTEVYTTSSGSCASTPVPSGAATYRFGAELPQDRFAEVHEETD